MSGSYQPQIITENQVAALSAHWNKDGKSKGSNGKYYTCCPIHGDDSPSLSMKWVSGKTGDGGILYKCHAKDCDWKQIANAAEDTGIIPKWQPAPRTANDPDDKGSSFWRFEKDGLQAVEGYSYKDVDGTVLFEKWRFWDNVREKKEFRQRQPNTRGGWLSWDLTGVKRVLFCLPEVDKEIAEGKTILIVEGEKDVLKARADGLAATCNFEGAATSFTKWRESYSQSLKGAKRIIIVVDNDYAGYEHLNVVASSLQLVEAVAEWLVLPVPEHGDYSDWRETHEAAEITELLASAKTWTGNVKNPYPSPAERKRKEDAVPGGISESAATTNVAAIKPEVQLINVSFIEKFTDSGNATRLLNKFGQEIRYCKNSGWYLWKDTRWITDGTGKIREKAKETVRAIGNEGDSESLQKFIKKCLDESKLQSMIRCSQSLDGISCEIQDFDKDPFLFNCQDGMVNLKTGECLPHDRNMMCSQIANCGFDKEAYKVFEKDNVDDYWDLMPQFMDMMTWICGTDWEKLSYLQEVAGYSMSAGTSLQQAWICEGAGRNLKSTLIDNLVAMFGDYAITIPANMFMRTNTPDNQMYNPSQLLGKRLAAVQEMNSDDCLDEAKFKTVTGHTDVLKGRFLHFEPFEFRNTAKLIFRTNHLPRIRNQDDGVWRRIRRIPFHNQLPEDQVIGNFDEVLKKEWSIICAFYVRGAVRVLNRGRLDKPACVAAMDEEYRKDMDIIGTMLEECFVKAEGAEVSAADMQRVHKIYCERYGQSPVSGIELGRRLAQKGVQRTRDSRSRGYTGYEVAPEFAQPKYSSKASYFN